jgi:hypothetical protein
MIVLSGPTLPILNRERREEQEALLAAREQALRLGWSLLTSVGKGQNEQLPRAGAISAFSMAERDEGPKDRISSRSVTNDEVVKLLAEIRRDWQSRPGEAPPTPLDAISPEDDMDMEESVETVLLSLADLEQINPPLMPEEEEIALETILQSPSRGESPEDTDKTVVLSAAPGRKAIDFEKTVILNVGRPAESPAEPMAAAAPSLENKIPEASGPVEMEETVIISADYGATGSGAGAVGGGGAPTMGAVQAEPPQKQAIKEDEADLMEATVILKVDGRPKTRGNR